MKNPPPIPGGLGYYEEPNVPVKCPKCGYQWTTRMYYEMGEGHFELPADAECPSCGAGEAEGDLPEE